MKKIILALAVLMTAQSSFAGSCTDLYHEVAAKKKAHRKDNTKWALDTANGMAGWTMGFTIGSAFNPAILPIAVFSASIEATFYLVGTVSAVSTLTVPEQRALGYIELARKGEGFVRRILIKVRKKNINATMEDVTSIITRGFESGDFCANPGKLFGPRKIRKYVLERI